MSEKESKEKKAIECIQLMAFYSRFINKRLNLISKWMEWDALKGKSNHTTAIYSFPFYKYWVIQYDQITFICILYK